jgi:microcystin-dependent protein
MPSDPFVAQVSVFGFNFAPRGWAFCDGALLPISQNTALFSLLLTMYGGNGQSTFALPDLRGRAPLAQTPPGAQGGQRTVTLAANQMPAHAHVLHVSSAEQTTNRPDGALPAKGGAYAPSDGTVMDAEAVAPAGGGQAHENMPPYVVLNFCVAQQGIFPPHS